MKGKLIIGSLAIASLCVGIGSCSHDFHITGETGDVVEVIDGNTVRLDNGLTVHLLGISPQNAFTKEYLQNNVLNHGITLTADPEWGETFQTYDDEVYAYATTTDDYQALNRKLLTLAGEKAFVTAYVSDSLDTYKKIFEDNDRKLTQNELAALLKGASMLVFGEGDDGVFIGTAFFINDKGLAISNNHVVQPGNNYKFYVSDSQGNINYTDGYSLNRIVATQDYHYGPDYSVFYVNVDQDALAHLQPLKIAKHRPVSGDFIATVGNPAPNGQQILNMSYASGEVSAVRDKENILQINAPITHGFSGGPLVNDKGQVVGISSSGFEDNNANLNFAVDIQVVRDAMDAKNLPYAGK